MTVYNLAWAVVLVPLGAAAASYVVESMRRAAMVCVAGTAASLVIAVIVLIDRLGHISQNPHQASITFWTYAPGQLPYGSVPEFHPQVGILVDGLSAAVMPAIAAVALLCQLHALQYLRNDGALRRFMVISSLLVFGSLGLVASPDLFQTYLMWEVVGVTSCLLLGHWWHRSEVAAGAVRVLLVTRVGDLSLLLALAIGFVKLAPDVALLPPVPGQDFNDPLNLLLLGQAEWPRLAGGVVVGSGTHTLVLLAYLVLVAALSKAAQLPFSGWVPAATTGPTPALAMALGVGMVPAGVYLLARTYALLELAPHVLTVVAVVGSVTAVYAAVAALAQTDVKRLLGFLSMAHAGLMFVALGTGSMSAAVFHLITYSFFITLLVLAAGNVIAAYGTQDIRSMGGAGRRMPRTSLLLLVGTMSAAMVPVLAGYWSSESIVAGILRNRLPHGGRLSGAARAGVLVATCVAIALTAAAAGRLYVTVCQGEPTRRRGFTSDRVREAAPALLVPLVALAVGATVLGLVGIEGLRVSVSNLVYASPSAPGYDASPGALLLTAALAFAGVGALLVARGRTLSIPARLRKAAVSGLWLDTALAAAVRRGSALVGPLPSRVDEEVTGAVTAGVAESVLLLGDGVGALRSHRLSLQLLGAVSGALVLVAAVTLAATGHLPGVGAAR